MQRRAILATLGTGLAAGCLSGGGDGDGESPTPTGKPGDTPTPEACDPESVSRPPIVRDTDHPPQGYGTKPMELTALSAADYLSDFETGYAWNRILATAEDVVSLGVNTVDGYQPTPDPPGFLASSRIETHYAVGEEQELTERGYVVSYYVSPSLVYRAETDEEPVDPQTHETAELVQCGPE